MNINLYSDNPTFEMSGNKALEENKKLIDIYLDDASELNFINNSDNEATIKLGNGIKGKGSVTFKNNDDNENGSFKLELGRAGIEAKNINIESNVTLLLTINSKGILGGLKGYRRNLNLTISGDKQLIIELQKIEDIDKPRKSYIIISDFENYLLNNLVNERKIVLKNNKIKINDITYDLSLSVPKIRKEVVLKLKENQEEAKRKEEERKRLAEEEKEEAEAKGLAEEEKEKIKAEEEEKEEAKAKKLVEEEEARKKAEEEAKRKAEEEAKKKLKKKLRDKNKRKKREKEKLKLK